MYKYVQGSSQPWCEDKEGNVVYEGDIIRDEEGWEYRVDKIRDDGTVDLNLWEDGQGVEEHYGEYSKSDIKREFEQV